MNYRATGGHMVFTNIESAYEAQRRIFSAWTPKPEPKWHEITAQDVHEFCTKDRQMVTTPAS